jgi:DNA repair protein RecN (Recombination protein N)
VDPFDLGELAMLRELSVQNLALIENVGIDLAAGFCAWTGETGAGKSLLLGALGLLMGERGSSELIRTGAEELRVTGSFDLHTPEVKKKIETLLDITLDDGEILLSRRLTRNGRSNAYINEQPVSLKTLEHVGSLLVDIHGQRATESLLQPAYQLQVLDSYGNLGKYRQAYLELAEKLRDARKRYQTLSAEQQKRQRELTLVRFERQELDDAALEPGETPKLQAERQRLASAQDLQEFAEQAWAMLYDEEGSVVERLGRVKREAEGWVKMDEQLADVVEALEGTLGQVQDVAQTIRKFSDRWEADPQRLEEVEARLQFIRKLESKYRKNVDELIAYHAGLDEIEEKLQSAEDDLEGLQGEMSKLFAQLKEAAEALSKQRQKVAKKMASEVQKHLGDLGMKDAILSAELTRITLGEDPAGDIPAYGIDQMELTLAANPGEPARPLRKVASGGEMSRTMLALKSVLAAHDEMGTLIFDEIDANVGGRLGDVLGEKLASLGKTHQVICVTHLASVAGYARNHWSIRKSKKGGRTITQIRQLDENERIEEIAQMIRGDSANVSTREEAKGILEAGRKCW